MFCLVFAVVAGLTCRVWRPDSSQSPPPSQRLGGDLQMGLGWGLGSAVSQGCQHGRAGNGK